MNENDFILFKTMNQIHNTNPLEVAHFHRIDINLYPLFIAIFEQRAFLKLANCCVSANLRSATPYSVYVYNLKMSCFVRSGQKYCLRLMLSNDLSADSKMAAWSIQKLLCLSKILGRACWQSIKSQFMMKSEPIIFPQLVHHFSQLNLNIQFLSSKLDRKNMLLIFSTTN